MVEDLPTFAVAIPVSNEAQNIIPLLERVVSARPARVLVVSDGSTDDTDALVRSFAARSVVPVALMTSPDRRGKADAVNRIIAALPDVVVIAMISGDAMPAEGCVERLVAAFRDPSVGVAAGRPVPEGPEGVPAVDVSRLLWALHHRIALASPKSTEITVFRNVLPGIDPASRTDEAAIEAGVASRGYRVVYVPDALIRTNCPLSLRDYVRQRTSVTMGHLSVARDGYGVGTLSWRQRFRALGDVWREEGVKLSTLARAVVLESGIYGAAWFRLHFGPRINGIWTRQESTKRPFER
jgi:cellulose synthase/poly-beta-1,6-N-acetylglucosamine synthase-like glycosyltransferase